MSATAVSPENRAMSSIFISNISVEIAEDILKALLSEFGQVMNFRTFPDKNTNKLKVAFCEFKNPEMAMRAIHTLNGYEFKGLPIHLDLATSEKCRQELERLQGSIEATADVPDATSDKAPEEISKAVASLPAEQMFELMKQMKLCIENNPQEARTLLLQNPQLAYALLQAQVIMRIVDPNVAVQILNRPSVPPASVNSEVKTEPIPAATSVSEDPSAFPPGMTAITSDPTAMNVSTTMTQSVMTSVPGPEAVPGPVTPARQPGMPMMPGPQSISGVPNQFADQDLRVMGDQDLRTLPPNISDRDMRVPPVMLGVDKDMRQPMGDHDFRTLGVPAPMAENRPFDPRYRNMQGADRNAIPGFDRPRPANADPRTPYDPRSSGAARVEDPRKASQAATLNSRLSAAGSSMGIGGMQDEQEKAALIMQVLQLTDQQIAALPPEQRQSIMVLKEQLARSQMI